MDDGLKFARSISSDRFYKELEALVKNHKLNYMDAVVFFCEKYDIEIETAASMIKGNSRLKSHLQTEGEALNFLPRTAKLPI